MLCSAFLLWPSLCSFVPPVCLILVGIPGPWGIGHSWMLYSPEKLRKQTGGTCPHFQLSFSPWHWPEHASVRVWVSGRYSGWLLNTLGKLQDLLNPVSSFVMQVSPGSSSTYKQDRETQHCPGRWRGQNRMAPLLYPFPLQGCLPPLLCPSTWRVQDFGVSASRQSWA